MKPDSTPRLTCEDAERLMDGCLGRDESEMPAGLAGHLSACSRCARLYAWLRSAGQEPAPPPKLVDDVTNRLCATLRPVTPLPGSLVLAAWFFGAFVLLLAGLAWMSGAGAVELFTPLQLVTVGVVLAGAGLALVCSLSWQVVPARKQGIRAAWLIGGLAAVFAAAVGTMFPWEDLREVAAGGWQCTYHGAVLAAPVGVAMLLLALRGAPLCPRTLGATVGAVAGLAGLIILELSCRVQSAGHIILWHGGVVALAVLTGYLAGVVAERAAARR